MYEKAFLLIASILIIIGGFYICLRPKTIGQFLKNFYGNYPLVQYAGEKQLTTRNIFVRLIGILFIAVGLACAISVI